MSGDVLDSFTEDTSISSPARNLSGEHPTIIKLAMTKHKQMNVVFIVNTVSPCIVAIKIPYKMPWFPLIVVGIIDVYAGVRSERYRDVAYVAIVATYLIYIMN